MITGARRTSKRNCNEFRFGPTSIFISVSLRYGSPVSPQRVAIYRISGTESIVFGLPVDFSSEKALLVLYRPYVPCESTLKQASASENAEEYGLPFVEATSVRGSVPDRPHRDRFLP